MTDMRVPYGTETRVQESLRVSIRLVVRCFEIQTNKQTGTDTDKPFGMTCHEEDNRKVPQRKMDRTTKKRSVLKKQLTELIGSHERTLTHLDLVRYMKTHRSIVLGDIPINPKVRSSMESFNQSVTSPGPIKPNEGLNLALPGAG